MERLQCMKCYSVSYVGMLECHMNLIYIKGMHFSWTKTSENSGVKNLEKTWAMCGSPDYWRTVFLKFPTTNCKLPKFSLPKPCNEWDLSKFPARGLVLCDVMLVLDYKIVSSPVYVVLQLTVDIIWTTYICLTGVNGLCFNTVLY